MTLFNGIQLIIIILALVTGCLMFWSLPIPHPQSKTGGSLPFVSIIVPARNEENRIKPLLRSLQQQSFQSFELLVVDDDSQDHTADVAREYGARVVFSTEKTSGAGKSSACWLGATHAKGEWLLFLDADTALVQTNSLNELLQFHLEQGATGITSVQPFHTVSHLYENLSAIFNIIVIVGMNPFTFWKQRFKPAGSFGPCILCNKKDYFLSGGHDKIRHEVIDDLALGQSFLDKGLPVRCLGGKGIVSFRMYEEGFYSLVEGWCKSFALGSASTHPFVMMLVILWITGSFMSVGSFVSSLLSGSVQYLLLSSLLYVLYAFQTARFARRCGNFKGIFFLFFPVLFLFFAGVFLYSLFRVHILRSVKWKDRKIDV